MGVEGLLANFTKHVSLPWEPVLAGPQKVWFAIYAPTEERRFRARIGAFEAATIHAGHRWQILDLTHSFAVWMANHEYREEYFEAPDDMQMALDDYAESVIAEVKAALAEADTDTLFAICGIASLFGFMRASRLVEAVAPAVRGRLLVFFPGQRDGPNYRLLDARDGWNYLAIPITDQED